jgi:colicin import membrane protein
MASDSPHPQARELRIDPQERIFAGSMSTAAAARYYSRRLSMLLIVSLVLHLCLLMGLNFLENGPPVRAEVVQEIAVDLVTEPPPEPKEKPQPEQKSAPSPAEAPKPNPQPVQKAEAKPELAKPEPKPEPQQELQQQRQQQAETKTEPPVKPKSEAQKPQRLQSAPKAAQAPKPASKATPVAENKPPPSEAKSAEPKPPVSETKPEQPSPPSEAKSAESKPPASEAKPEQTSPPPQFASLPNPVFGSIMQPAPIRAETPPQEARLPPQPALVPPNEDSWRAVAMPAPTDDGDLIVAYKTLVFSKLELAKQFPDEARQRHAHGAAVIAFALDEKGEVENVILIQSSGDPALDAESLALVERAAPFPSPPPGAQKEFAAEIDFNPDQ